MTSDAIDILKREIAKRQAEIGVLNMALEALSGKAPEQPSQQLMLPAPNKRAGKKKPAAAKGETSGLGVFEVNGREVKFGPTSFAIMEKVAQADDCCPKDRLIPLCGGKADNVCTYIKNINGKLKSAGAEIVHFKGEGYRLQNIGGNV